MGRCREMQGIYYLLLWVKLGICVVGLEGFTCRLEVAELRTLAKVSQFSRAEALPQ